jgi:hypothetical protein
MVVCSTSRSWRVRQAIQSTGFLQDQCVKYGSRHFVLVRQNAKGARAARSPKEARRARTRISATPIREKDNLMMTIHRAVKPVIMAFALSLIIAEGAWHVTGNPPGCSTTTFGSYTAAGPFLCPHGAYCWDGINYQQLRELALPTVGWDCTGASPAVDTFGTVSGEVRRYNDPYDDELYNVSSIRHFSQTDPLQYSTQSYVCQKFCDGSTWINNPLYHGPGSCGA